MLMRAHRPAINIAAGFEGEFVAPCCLKPAESAKPAPLFQWPNPDWEDDARNAKEVPAVSITAYKLLMNFMAALRAGGGVAAGKPPAKGRPGDRCSARLMDSCHN